MHTRARELVEYGKQCGFTLQGLDGRGHWLLTHPNGSRVRVACTPGDQRGDDNTRAEMRRKSGVTPPRPNAGRHRHKKGSGFTMPGPSHHPTGERTVGGFVAEGRQRLLTEHARLMSEYETAPTGELEVRLRNIAARLRCGIY